MYIHHNETWGAAYVFPFADNAEDAAWTWNVGITKEGAIMDGAIISIPDLKKKMEGYLKAIEIAEERLAKISKTNHI